jgi:hypothetical protein
MRAAQIAAGGKLKSLKHVLLLEGVELCGRYLLP